MQTMCLQDCVRLLQTNWKELLLQYPHWDRLENSFNIELGKESELECFPLFTNIFACFDYFNIEDTKVIILGQDPYHGKGQATGVAFAVNKNINPPPSLKNIFKLIGSTNTESTLESWAQQGVLLLNTYLTVRESKPGSHCYLWEDFTRWLLNTIGKLNLNQTNVLWGAHAYKIANKSALLNGNDLISSHPSPLSAYKAYGNYPPFLESNVFEKTNAQLKKQNKIPIKW